MLCRQGSQKRCSGRQLLLSGMKFTALAKRLAAGRLKARPRLCWLASVSPPLAADKRPCLGGLPRRLCLKEVRCHERRGTPCQRAVSPPPGSTSPAHFKRGEPRAPPTRGGPLRKRGSGRLPFQARPLADRRTHRPAVRPPVRPSKPLDDRLLGRRPDVEAVRDAVVALRLAAALPGPVQIRVAPRRHVRGCGDVPPQWVRRRGLSFVRAVPPRVARRVRAAELAQARGVDLGDVADPVSLLGDLSDIVPLRRSPGCLFWLPNARRGVARGAKCGDERAASSRSPACRTCGRRYV